ncbi:MAG: hypothetical protein LRY27_01025 [Chitinophagales bacterium]|nr:hypothetical protein [Chitinophagales bacterium]
MKKRYLFIYLLLLGYTFTYAQEDNLLCRHFDEAGRIREHNVDFLTMELHVDFDTEQKKVFGKVVYTFKPLRENVKNIFIDAPGIDIEQYYIDGDYAEGNHTDEGLYIICNQVLDWNQEHTLSITYEAQPEKGLYFLGWDDTTNRARKQIWTQGQGIDNRYWIPGYDDVSDKLLTETYINFPTGYEVISNGDLVDKFETKDNHTTWHYKMNEPQVLYLVMIAIGEYTYQDIPSKNGVVNRQYYYPDKPEDFAPTYKYFCRNDGLDGKRIWRALPLGKYIQKCTRSRFYLWCYGKHYLYYFY